MALCRATVKHSWHIDQLSSQRAYVACGQRRHIGCFKYQQLDDRWASAEAAACWLAAWRHKAMDLGLEYNKQHHKEFQPTGYDVSQCRVVDTG